MKEYKTVEQQISILKERGLIFENYESAKLYLLTNNYYNIINGYSKFFQNEQDKYIEKTDFGEIKQVYLFDKKLKHALFTSIIDTELHIKSIFSHRFSEKFKNISDAYLNVENYDKNSISEISNTIYQLKKIIKRQSKYSDSSIYHYTKKHKSVPLWVLVNYMSFGVLRYMLKSVNVSLQNLVARDLMSFVKIHLDNAKIFPPETMMSFIENINDLRNVCAHNNRLIGFNCRRDSRFW